MINHDQPLFTNVLNMLNRPYTIIYQHQPWYWSAIPGPSQCSTPVLWTAHLVGGAIAARASADAMALPGGCQLGPRGVPNQRAASNCVGQEAQEAKLRVLAAMHRCSNLQAWSMAKIHGWLVGGSRVELSPNSKWSQLNSHANIAGDGPRFEENTPRDGPILYLLTMI